MNSLIRICLNLASQSQQKIYKHSAIIFKSGMNPVIRTVNTLGCNNHAEINAISILCRHVPRKKRKKYSIIIIRKHLMGHMCNSQPCQMCAIAIQYSGIGRVIYSYNDNTIIKCTPNHLTKEHVSKGIKKIGINDPLIKNQLLKIKNS